MMNLLDLWLKIVPPDLIKFKFFHWLKIKISTRENL